MAKPKRFPGLVNTSPNSVGMKGSRTVAQAVNRARTSINPHADFFDFSPTQYLPDEDMYGATDVVEQPMPFYPSYGPPGLGDPSVGTEYGAIPNRGRMQREIDIMMGARPSGGLGGGAQHPSAASASGPANPYSPSGYGGQRGMGAGGPSGFAAHNNPPASAGIDPAGMATAPAYYGVPGQQAHSVYEPEPIANGFPISGNIYAPDPTNPQTFTGMNSPMSYQTQPETFTGMNNPMGPLDPDPQTFTGVDSPMSELSKWKPWDKSGNDNDAGIGLTRGDLSDQIDELLNTYDSPNDGEYGRSEPYSAVTEKERAAERWANPKGIGPDMNQLGIGGSRTEDGQVVAQNPETAVANYEVEKKLRDDLMAEREARWGEASNKDEQEQYLKDMEKTMKTQMLLEGLASWSGNANAARLAQSWGTNAMALLNKKYEFAADDRISQMSSALMRDKNGNPDSPKDRQELYQALDVMGASSAERDYFDELMFGDGTTKEDGTYRNFINTRTGETYSGYGPKDESGEWAITGQYDYGTKDGKTPGGVDMEKYQIWQAAKADNEAGIMSDEELGDLKKALGLSDRGITLNQEFSMFESIYKSGVGGRWKIPGLKRQPTAADIEEAFQEFREKTMPMLRGAMPDAEDEGMSREDAEAKVRSENPNSTPEEINKWLDDNGY